MMRIDNCPACEHNRAMIADLRAQLAAAQAALRLAREALNAVDMVPYHEFEALRDEALAAIDAVLVNP